MIENQIPNEWNEVLATVQSVFPLAVIAGGALRDLDYDKSVKDIDIFIPISCSPDNMFDHHIHRLFEGKDITMVNASVYGQTLTKEFDRLIYAVYDLKLDGKMYNLIITNDQGNDITTFDFSICQISWNGKTIVTTEAYDETKSNKIIKLMTTKQSAERVAGREGRLKEKFPDYEFDTSLLRSFDVV